MTHKIQLQLISAFILLLLSVSICHAQLTDEAFSQASNQTQALGNSANYDTSDNSGDGLTYIIAQIIQVVLAMLAIVFLILIVLAGYNWMMASGEEEKVKKASTTIRTAIIGLIIILGAYAITYFVFNQLPLGIGAGEGGTGVTAYD